MKNITILLFCFLTISCFSQEKKSKSQKATIVVSGNCEHCQMRITKTALSQKGVKYASWDIPSNQLSLIYNARKVDLIDIQRAIAKSGHDTGKLKAPDITYEQLPGCCRYDRKSEKE